MQNPKNLLRQKIKKKEEIIFKLEERLSKLSRYYDYDDKKYKRIRDVQNLLDGFDEDYYRPIKTKSVFDGDYIEYESKGDTSKNLSPETYLDMIRPYLSDMINDHKTRREWKIQLTISINFISSKDFVHNIELMIGNETDEIINEPFESLLQNYQKDLEASLGRGK